MDLIFRRGILCMFAMSWAIQSAMAINIVMQLQQEGMNPTDDPNGTRLLAIANAAASFWEDYLPESGTYEVDIWWDTDELSGNTWGRWNFQVGGDNNIRINADPRDSNNAPVQWFFDSTPTEHGEFDFVTQDRVLNMAGTQWIYRGGQWLYRDVDPQEQIFWFGETPPDVMEIGYRGRAFSSTLQNQADLFSTVIHEIGHELGVNNSGGPWEADPIWIPGYNTTFFENSGGDHLAARTSLMCGGCGLIGTRRLPSAVDIMAAAVDESMTLIDLPRQDYIGSGTWHSLFHWTGSIPPDANDDAFLRDSNTVLLTANAQVENLWASNSSSLHLQSNTTLTVDDQATFSDQGGDSSLWVTTNATAKFNALTLDGTSLHLIDGVVDVTNDLILSPDNITGGQISTYGGMVRVGRELVNDGEIVAFGGTTTFTYTGQPSDKLDFDGADEAGQVNALLGDLIFDAEMTDDFDGMMVVEDGQSIITNHDWTLGQDGELHLRGTTSDPALWGGPANTIVEGTVDPFIGILATNQTTFESTSQVKVDSGADRLILDTTTFFKGGTHSGDGAIEQQDNVHVQKDTTIDTGEYDWGNSTTSEAHDTYVSETATFTINSSTTGTQRNEYRGTIFINGATLDVNLDTGWLLPRREGDGLPSGTLFLNPGDQNAPRILGVPLTVEGNVRANGGIAHMEADFITTSWADIRSLIGAELLLKGHNTYDGGTIIGDGEIGQWGDADVVSDTTIGTNYYDLDGDESSPSTTTIHPGISFTINSDRIDKPGESYSGSLVNDGGTFAVNTPGAWTLGESGSVHLKNNNGPAFVTGAHINIDGTVQTTGGNEIFPSVTFHNSAQVVAVQPNDILRLRGHTNYEGGIYSGGGGIIQDATAFVNALTAMHLGFFDMDGIGENSLIELHDDLFLNVDTIDLNDNQFDGILEVTDTATLAINTPNRWTMAGTMNVVGPPATTMTVDGAEVVLAKDVYVDQSNRLQFDADVSGKGNFTGDGSVSFFGKYSPGNSPANVTADGDIVFTESASLLVEIGGNLPGSEYDVLSVAGTANLGGILDVSLIDLGGMGSTFEPSLGDQFTIVDSMLGLNGMFATEKLPFITAGLGWDVVYGNNELVLEVVEALLPADFDMDGDVDGDDLNVWEGSYGVDAGADADSDGDSDGADFLAWQQQFGSSLESSEVQAVPEPATLILLALASILLASQRKQLC